MHPSTTADRIMRDAIRMNERYESMKTHSHYTEADLQIIITATHDLYDLVRALQDAPHTLFFGSAFVSETDAPFDQDAE